MHLSAVELNLFVKLTHNLHITLMSNTPTKSFFVDFIYFEIILVQHLSIEQIDVWSLVF